MKQLLTLTSILIILLLVGCAEIEDNLRQFESVKYDSVPKSSNLEGDLRVCFLNPQIFGVSKAQDDKFMSMLKQDINECDLFFLLEIREISGDSFRELCADLPEYKCSISERDGRTSSKEQIGVLSKVGARHTISTMLDPADVWERSPVIYNIEINNEPFTFYVLHTKPDASNPVVRDELKELELRISDKLTQNQSVFILGDLNADCDYYNSVVDVEFDDWAWVVQDYEDTTASNTHCAYDRIIANNYANSRVVSYGIDSSTTADYSDHYLVWMEVKI